MCLSQHFKGSVTCSISSPISNSQTSGSFDTIKLSADKPQGNVTFTCQKVGGRSPFHCFMIGNPSVIMQTWYIHCKEPPVVNVVPDSVYSLKRALPFTLTLLAELSEVASGSSVDVYCFRSKDQGAIFSTSPVYVSPGTKSRPISLQITSYGDQLHTEISCIAQSTDGHQYEKTSSLGAPATLIFEGGIMKISPNRERLHTVKFWLSLTLNGIIGDLNVICRVDVATNESAVQALLENSNCTAPSVQSQTENAWTLKPTDVVFKVQDSTTAQTLSLSRNSYPTKSESGTVETVVVLCCNPSTNFTADPAFAGISSTARIDVLLPEPLNVISDGGLPSNEETVLPNPAFVNVAPCPCDLTPGFCDLGCCCDQLCPSQQAVPCAIGPFGGNSTVTDSFSCSAEQFLVQNEGMDLLDTSRVPNFFPALCTAVDNGAVLGLFYQAVNVARNSTAFTDNYPTGAKSSELSLVHDTGARQFSESGDPVSQLYVQGDVLYLIAQYVQISTTEAAPTIVDSTDKALLSLPDPVNCALPSGSMLTYLNNLDRYECPIQLDQALCQEASLAHGSVIPGMSPFSIASRLLAQVYLISDSLAAVLPPPVHQIRANRLLDTTRTLTRVNYYCLDETAVAQLVGSSQKTSQVESGQMPIGFFDQWCSYNSSDLSTVCTSKYSANSTLVNKADCTWNHGYQLPPAVQMDGSVCRNVVIQVDYRFGWSGGSVVSAEADVYLANISMPATYYQSFLVHFSHYNDSTPLTNEETVISGVYGYDTEAPLITGRVNKTSQSGFTVVVDDGTGLGIPKPGPSRLCGTASLAVVRFGENSIGTCEVYLIIQNFTDCQRLRSMIAYQLKRYVSTDVIAVYGSPSTSSFEDWVPIQRIEPVLQDQKTVTYLGLEITGRCENVPAAMTLDIFYATQGQVDGQPILQVVGAQTSYEYVDWQINCSLPQTIADCRNPDAINLTNPSASQPFRLTVNVQFTQVSPEWASSVSKLPNASKHLTDQDDLAKTCPNGACWKDAFYPWSTYRKLLGSRGLFEATFEVAAGLAIGALAVGVLVLTQPFL